MQRDNSAFVQMLVEVDEWSDSKADRLTTIFLVTIRRRPARVEQDFNMNNMGRPVVMEKK